MTSTWGVGEECGLGAVHDLESVVEVGEAEARLVKLGSLILDAPQGPPQQLR
jgi:hypothetical protein